MLECSICDHNDDDDDDDDDVHNGTNPNAQMALLSHFHRFLVLVHFPAK